MKPTRYKVIQPDTPPELRGSIWRNDGRVYKVGDLIEAPRRDGSVRLWKVAAIEQSPDPTWTAVLRCEFADASETPAEATQQTWQPATQEAFDRWHEASERDQ